MFDSVLLSGLKDTVLKIAKVGFSVFCSTNDGVTSEVITLQSDGY
jgi:hypothetical protein